MRKKDLFFSLAAGLLPMFFFGPPVIAQDVFNGSAVEVSAEQRGALDKLFSECAVFDLEVDALHDFVRSHPEHSVFTLNLGRAHHYTIDLREYDLRAPDYLCQETGATGLVTLPRTPCMTYKGELLGESGSVVRLNIERHRIWGILRKERSTVHLEPLRNFDASAPSNYHVLYYQSDIISGVVGECGGGEEDGPSRSRPAELDGARSVTGNDCRKLDIATESDWEFYDDGQTFADILGNLNLVEDVYWNYFGMAFQVRYQHQWTTSSDPYTNDLSGCSSYGELDEFTEYWFNGFSHIRRDISVLYSEKSYSDGNTVGCAYKGQFGNGLSNNGYYNPDPPQILGAYCVNEWVDGIFYTQAHRTCLIAHEMGHVFGANHDDSNCGLFESGNIMCPSVVTNLVFLPTAIAEMEAGMNYDDTDVTHDGRRALRERYAPASALSTFVMPINSGFNGNVVISDRPCSFQNASAGQFVFSATDTVRLTPGFVAAPLSGQTVKMTAGSPCLIFNP